MAITRENIESRINYLDEVQHKIVEEKTLLWNLLDLYNGKGFKEIHELEELTKPEVDLISDLDKKEVKELRLVINRFPESTGFVVFFPISVNGARHLPFSEHTLKKWLTILLNNNFIQKVRQARYIITDDGLKLMDQLKKGE